MASVGARSAFGAVRPRPGGLRTRLGARVRAVPKALWALLLVAALHGTAWALVLPPLSGPDEIAHAAYVQALVENGDGPQRNEGTGPESLELSLAAAELYLIPIRGHGEGKPAWASVDDVERKLERITAAERSNGTGPNSAGVNPPLYYLLGAVPWAVDRDGSLLGRLLAVRLLTVLLFVVAVGLTWLVAAELFAATWQRFVATAVVALHPKLGHTAGQINPDLLVVVMVTGMLAAALRLVRRGPTPGRLLALGLTAGGAVLSHPRGLFALPVAGLVLLVVAFQQRAVLRRAPRRLLLPGLGAVAALVLGFAGAYAYSRAHAGGAAFGGNAPQAAGFNVREFLSYLWQFYFPPFGFFEAKIGPGFGYRQMYIQTFFGGYATFAINFADLTLDRLQVAAYLGLLGLLIAVAVHRRELVRRWPVPLVCLAFLGTMLLQLHLTSYASLRGGGLDVVITGRYLLPAIALYGCAIAFVVGSMPRRIAPVAAGVALGVAVLLCLGGLGLTFGRFYG